MVMGVRFYNAVLLWGLSFSLAQGAELALTQLNPLHLNALYVFDFSGIGFGKAGVAISQEPGAFEMVADVSSSGLARVFVKHDSHSVGSGVGKDFRYPECEYDSRYQTRGKKKHVRMRYHAGTVADQLVEPPDNPASRPPVAKELKAGTLDPLRFGLAMRSELYKAMKDGKKDYTLRIYDGRRLTEARFEIQEPTQIEYQGAMTAVFAVGVSRTLLEGFSASELADARDRPDPPLTIYFTQDERLIPIVMEVPLWLGRVRATLVKTCETKEACLLGLNP